MKTMIVTSLLGLLATNLHAQDGPQPGKVDGVFCVDRSGSMDQVIDAEMKKKNLKADASFDEAVRRTIQEQAAKQLNK